MGNIQEFVFGNVSAKMKPPARQTEDSKNVGPEMLEESKGGSGLDNVLSMFNKSTIDEQNEFITQALNLNSISEVDEKVKILKKYSILLILAVKFNWLYTRIFGSQIKILIFLNSVKDADIKRIKDFYIEAQNKFPETYKTYSFDEYLMFLKSNQLLTVAENNLVSITDYGKDFISYIVNGKFNLDLPN